MSEHEQAQERTEQPTPRRLEQAREKGQVPRSRELNTMAVMIAGACAFLVFGAGLADGVRELLTDGLSLQRAQAFETRRIVLALRGRLIDALLLLAPLLATLVVAALLAPAALGGFNFSAKAAAPKLERLSVLRGIKRIFSAQGAMEFGKTLLKFAVLVAVGATLLWSQRHRLLALGGQSPEAALSEAAALILLALFTLAAALVLIAAVDAPFQLWNHHRRLKMTRQEVKDERKQTEGNPEVRGKVRRLQREMAQARMMEAVAEADVVITNPEHFAVALRYGAERDRAPRVVAKGADRVALRIRRRAAEHSVPRCEAAPLARAIYYTTELGEEIPAALYQAVAQVLAWVYRLRRARRDGEPEPNPPPDLTVPEKLLERRGRFP